MKIINLKTPLADSQILIQKDGLSSVRDWISEKHPDSKIVIVTDTNLADIYRVKLKTVFPDALVLTVIAGERSKNLSTIKRLATDMLESGIGRADVIIGFGGGMVTDLAGFTASVYMRGITFIAVSTSLLGMTDAAIGGKTGVDTTAKNILGTFYPAELVLIDPSFLKTLPDREFRSGLAEVIKYAATLDASLAEDLERDELPIDRILEKSARAKARIVEQDFRESGIRKVLNFGHTFGHAVEQLSNYKLSHGEAISIGMVLANIVAHRLGKQTDETGERIKRLLSKYDLPTALPDGMTVKNLEDLIQKDKKRRGNKISFVITPKIGEYEIIDLSVAGQLIKLIS